MKGKAYISKGPEMRNPDDGFARYYSSAREGLKEILAARLQDGTNRVLLPAYIGWSPREGSGIFDAVQELELDAHFYPVSETLRPDLRALSTMIADVPSTVLLVHYFGRIVGEAGIIAKLVRKQDSFLIEDCAHCLIQPGQLSRRIHGDAAIYSLHKMLSAPDGGVLWTRDEVRSLEASTRGDLGELLCVSDYSGIAQARRSNFLSLVDNLKRRSASLAGVNLTWTKLANDDVPQSLPILTPEGSRDFLYHYLNGHGVGATSLYHTLVEPLYQSEVGAGVAVSRRILNLPIHQDVDPGHIPLIADILVAGLAAWKARDVEYS